MPTFASDSKSEQIWAHPDFSTKEARKRAENLGENELGVPKNEIDVMDILNTNRRDFLTGIFCILERKRARLSPKNVVLTTERHDISPESMLFCPSIYAELSGNSAFFADQNSMN